MYKQQDLFKTVREASPEYFAQITQSPWDNVYWFARMLIASDKYGGIGTDMPSMLEIAATIQAGLTRLSNEENEIITKVLMETIKNILRKRWEHTRKLAAVEALCDDLSERLLTSKDFQVLALTCERVMVPITQALHAIPSDDRVFAESIAGALLKTKGEAGLSTVINLWDELVRMVARQRSGLRSCRRLVFCESTCLSCTSTRRKRT